MKEVREKWKLGEMNKKIKKRIKRKRNEWIDEKIIKDEEMNEKMKK
jgi:hypothetical protein